jgi:NAD-dependent deacetylase
VVWFGEPIDPDVLRRASGAAGDADLFLSVGTSSVVHPAAGLLHMAHARGAFTAEINPEATASSSEVDLVIARGAEDVLPALDARMEDG